MSIDQTLETLGLTFGDPEEIFEIKSREGSGAFGRVFHAVYRSSRKEAALKVIPIALKPGQFGEDVDNVRKEIEFLRECDHSNVVAFYGAYYKDGALWIAMEYCGGGSVGDISRHRKLCEQEISVIMRGALEGLAHLHSKKKIHRDIKGGNILLTSDGNVKLADFGVSAQLRDTLSRRGTFVGTPYWMSPEMIQDCNYDYKADIWSLGITAIELADQRPPLFDEHPMRVLIQIPRNPSPRLKQPQDWSTDFSSFLQFCLTKSPQDRPSAVECLAHPFITCCRDIPHVIPGGIVRSISNLSEHAADLPLTSQSEASTIVDSGHSTESTMDELIVAAQEAIAVVSAITPPPSPTRNHDSNSDCDSVAEFVEQPTMSDTSLDEMLAMAQSSQIAIEDPPTSEDEDESVRDFNEDLIISTREIDQTTSSACEVNEQLDLNPTEMSDHVVDPIGECIIPFDLPIPLAIADVPHEVHDSPRPQLERSQPETEPMALIEPKPFVVMKLASAQQNNFIGTPFQVAHQVRITYNTYDARYEGVPDSFQQLHQQFGIPLAQMHCSSNAPDDLVPALLRMLRRELGDGILAKYIYRSSPDHGQIQAAKMALNSGKYERKSTDPYLLSSLIKRWFRDLPTPLLSICSFQSFEALARLASKVENVHDIVLQCDKAQLNEAVDTFLEALDQQSRQIFEWLLDHWSDIVEKRASNMMNAHSLAVVWVPNLIHMPTSSPQEASFVSNQVATAIQVCMLWWQENHKFVQGIKPVCFAVDILPSPPKRIIKPEAALHDGRLFHIRQDLLKSLQFELDNAIKHKKSFQECQRLVLNSLRNHARSKLERDYAEKLLQNPTARTALRPISLHEVSRYLDVALDSVLFSEFVEQQEMIKQRLNKLVEDYPQLCLTPELTTFRPLTLPPSAKPLL